MRGKKESTFTALFILTIAIMVYFLGVSITGQVVQSMYCDGGVCKEMCDYIIDCTDKTQVCCDYGGFGVCEDPLFCNKGYERGAEADVDFDLNLKEPDYQRPVELRKTNPLFFAVLLAIAVVIGVIYYSRKKK